MSKWIATLSVIVSIFLLDLNSLNRVSKLTGNGFLLWWLRRVRHSVLLERERPTVIKAFFLLVLHGFMCVNCDASGGKWQLRIDGLF